MRKRILVVGDVMLDTFLTGDAQRISPEAPVPVVSVDQIFHRAGGAANLAVNLSGLGFDCTLLGCVGKDREADMLKSILMDAGVEFVLIEISDFPTTQKIRVISRNQQMIRLDREKNFDDLDVAAGVEKMVDERKFDSIAVSDYNKGFCSPALLGLLAEKAKRDDIKMLVDPKGKDWDKYRGTYLVKPNIHEMEEVTGVKLANDTDAIIKYGKQLLSTYDLSHLLITRGGADSILMDHHHHSFVPVAKVEVYDVTGAGDTTFAALIHGIHEGLPLTDAAQLANKAGAIAVSKPYTYSLTIDELEKMKG